MFKVMKNILGMASSGITEFISATADDGLVSASFSVVSRFFGSSENIKQYFNDSIKRSLISLEIALKGPRAYYPLKEKEFYQKHFQKFEQEVFKPFAEGVVKKGNFNSEEDLRNACIGECEEIKLTIKKMVEENELSENEIMGMLEKNTSFDSEDISDRLIFEIQKNTSCMFMVNLLQKDNVLMSGIVFHFYNFLKADSKFSTYVNYLQLSELKKNITNLKQTDVGNPKEKAELETRIKKMEQIENILSSYDNKMGAISNQLESIYEKTVQTFEILQRLEAEFKTGFNKLEEKLNTICGLIQNQNTNVQPANVDTQSIENIQNSVEEETEQIKPKKETETAEKNDIVKKKIIEEKTKPKKKISQQNISNTVFSKTSKKENAPKLEYTKDYNQKQAKIPNKYVRNVTAFGSAFQNTQEEKTKEQEIQTSQTPAISNIFLNRNQSTQSSQEENLSDVLQVYSMFLEASEEEDVNKFKETKEKFGISSIFFQADKNTNVNSIKDNNTNISEKEVKTESKSTAKIKSKDLSPECKKTEPLTISVFQQPKKKKEEKENDSSSTTKRSKRIRGDKISDAFGIQGKLNGIIFYFKFYNKKEKVW